MNPERAQDKQDAAEVNNYTRSPNMLIFGYRELSPQEKWLYVCLKHLCGKRGTRHLSLRYISEQTGISVGALSTSKDKKGNVNEGMIRHLHNTGLIHCEIKKHQGRGNALYHITITDVWALNQAFFIERKSRSDFGQGDGQEEDETTEPVRNSDEPVQISDKPARNSDKVVQISDEPVRNPGQYQERYKTTDKTENKTTGREEGTSREDHADTGSLHSPTPAHSPIATDTPTTEDEHGYTHPDMAFHGSALPARGSAHSHLAPEANSTAREVAHGQRDTTFAQQGGTPPAQTSQQPATSERGAPSAAMADSGYEKEDEQPTEKRPAVQLSTSVPQSGKVSHARTEGRKKKAEAPEPITLSHDAEKIWRAWCSLFTVEVELIPSNAAAAEKLVKPARAWCSKLHWTLAEWLKSVKDNAYAADNKGYYSKRGVKLFDIPRELEGWQSAKEHELSTLAQAANPAPTTPKPIDPTLQALRQQQMHYRGVTQ